MLFFCISICKSTFFESLRRHMYCRVCGAKVTAALLVRTCHQPIRTVGVVVIVVGEDEVKQEKSTSYLQKSERTVCL